jgi:hypothetical protein
VLRVAHYLRFESLRELAIQELYFLASPLEKIVCARDFGIDHWLKEAYTDICYRSSPLCEEEGIRLGLSTCLKIASAREAIRASTLITDPVHADSIIRKTFYLEVEKSEVTLAPVPPTIVPCCIGELKSPPTGSTDYVDRSPVVHDGKETTLQHVPQEGQLKEKEEVQCAEGKREGGLYTLPQAQVDVTKIEASVSEAISCWAEEANGSTHNHNVILAAAPPSPTEPSIDKPAKKKPKAGKAAKRPAKILPSVGLELRDSQSNVPPDTSVPQEEERQEDKNKEDKEEERKEAERRAHWGWASLNVPP